MFVLEVPYEVSEENKEKLRKAFRDRTGEDCIVLAFGMTLHEITPKKEQSLLKRLLKRI